MSTKPVVVRMTASQQAALDGLAALFRMGAIPAMTFTEMVCEAMEEPGSGFRSIDFCGIPGHPHTVRVEVLREAGPGTNRRWFPHRALVNSTEPAGRMEWRTHPVGHWA